jgi:hypothetical protein
MRIPWPWRRRRPMVTISAVVTRCRCTNPASHIPQPCPQGVTEDLGVVSRGRVRKGWGIASGAVKA